MPTPLQVGLHILDLVDAIITKRGKGSPSSSTWHFLREELAYQAENAVRDSYFMTRRSSTVAIVAILNATERVNDREYDLLTRGLMCVLKAFRFEKPRALLEAKDRLRCLVEDEEDNDASFTDVAAEMEAHHGAYSSSPRSKRVKLEDAMNKVLRGDARSLSSYSSRGYCEKSACHWLSTKRKAKE